MKDQQIGLLTLVMLVVAAMIGVGVFTSSGFALAALGNPNRVLMVWCVCGAWAMTGAVAYGALVRRVPLSGGEYLFLSRLVHPSVGFLAGWISLVAGFTAPIAASAKAVVAYGLPSVTSSAAANTIASAIIVMACVFHAMRTSVGTTAQNAIVLIKLGFIALLLLWAFGASPAIAWLGSALPNREVSTFPISASGWVTFFAAMSWIAFSYAGFNAAVYVAGESRAAQRNVPLAMLWATGLVTLIYLLLNVVFVWAPSSIAVVSDDASKASIAAMATRALGGAPMETLTRAIISLAVLSSVFGMLLAGPRVYMQMARDGVMPRLLRTVGEVPRRAIVMQGVLSVGVVWLTQLNEIIGYLGMTLSACSALAVAAIWRLGRSDLARQATLDYPLSWVEHSAAAIYIFGTVVMLSAVLIEGQRMGELLAMLATFVIGWLIYFVWSRQGAVRDKGQLARWKVDAP